MTTRELNKSRRKKIEQIVNKYFFAKKMKTMAYALSTNCSSDYDYMIKRVTIAFNCLDSLDKEIIDNQFFKKDRVFWWCGTYPTTTYYRFLKRAVNNFINEYEKAI